ncbi:hypothetical protein OQA88_12936 [Cercophora sp. LCS_1]
MTDKLPPLSTPIVPPSQTSHSLSAAVTLQQHAARKQESVEEEPYTIKCICGFADDDGNTIYCEKCETWQHIECYYPDNVEDAIREDFNHSCADCEPRPLNRQRAIERQRARTSVVPVVEEEASDKKAKRPPSKSHKKKPKLTDLHINGHHVAAEHVKHASPHDHSNPHPPKKSKNSHKPSQSISSQAPKRSPSYGKANGHPPSPATTPPDLGDEIEIHGYSANFLSRYNDQGIQIVRVNSFAGLQVMNTMSEWLRDPDKMQKETGCLPADVFQNLPPNIDALKITPFVEHVKKHLASGNTVHLPCLRAPVPIGKDVPLMELNGQIGFQASYCADPQHHWELLTAPLPFVLFHPMLPLYIDTRREGSEARYVRRSCKPNAIVETYLSGGREYHFWLVSDRQIPAKEQITIAWDFRLPKPDKARILRVLGLRDDESSNQPDPIIDDTEYTNLAEWVHRVLSEYGGCACNLGPDCAFAQFRRNHHPKAQARHPAQPSAPKSKKRKPKTQHTISPTSTGHATNSRAASEGHMDDVPEHEGRSVSGSSRSKPGSRDLTPTVRQGSFDQLGILTEPTDRDKRKVAMVEDSFRRMEQQQEHKAHPVRKRKRASDGTGTGKAKSTKPHSETPTLPNGFHERHYVDAGTSRSKSGSPTSATSPHSIHPPRRIGLGIDAAAGSHRASVGPHSNYRDAAVQTDDFDDGLSTRETSPVDTPRRKVMSLTKRLLDNRHRLRQDEQERLKRRSLEQQVVPVAMEVDSPTDSGTPIASPNLSKEAEKSSPTVGTMNEPVDTPMSDAPPPPPPTHHRLNGVVSSANPLKHKSPELRVQMPPVPAFGSPTASAPSTATTPLSAGTSIVQSPGGFANAFGLSSLNGVANPNPVKKKLSLSDYTKSRMNKTSRPTVGTTALKTMSEDPKSATSVGEGGLLDSPTAEKLNETASSTTAALTLPTAANEPL